MEWIWLGVIISLILIELVSINFTAIWFVFSGIISFILLKVNQNYMIQVLSFLIIGFFLIVVIRPLIIGKLLAKRDKIIKKVVNKYPFCKKLIPKEIKIDDNEKKEIKKSKKSNNSKVKRKKRKK